LPKNFKKPGEYRKKEENFERQKNPRKSVYTKKKKPKFLKKTSFFVYY